MINEFAQLCVKWKVENGKLKISRAIPMSIFSIFHFSLSVIARRFHDSIAQH